jgi:hypothetical protein
MARVTELRDFLIFKGQLVDGLPPSSAPPHPAAEVSVAIPVIGLTLQWRVEGKVKMLTIDPCRSELGSPLISPESGEP